MSAEQILDALSVIAEKVERAKQYLAADRVPVPPIPDHQSPAAEYRGEHVEQ